MKFNPKTQIFAKNSVKENIQNITLFFMLNSYVFFSNYAYAGEKEVVRSLEKVKSSIESGVSLNRLSELLADATYEINIAKRNKKISPEFIYAAKQCKGRYFLMQEWAKLPNTPEVRESSNDTFQNANIRLEKLYDYLAD